MIYFYQIPNSLPNLRNIFLQLCMLTIETFFFIDNFKQSISFFVWKKTHKFSCLCIFASRGTKLLGCCFCLLTNCGTNFGFCYSQLKTWATPAAQWDNSTPWSWSSRALSALFSYSHISLTLAGIFSISWLTATVLCCSLTVFQCPVSPRAECGILAPASLVWWMRRQKALEKIISSAPLRAKSASNSSKQKVLGSYKLLFFPCN